MCTTWLSMPWARDNSLRPRQQRDSGGFSKSLYTGAEKQATRQEQLIKTLLFRHRCGKTVTRNQQYFFNISLLKRFWCRFRFFLVADKIPIPLPRTYGQHDILVLESFISIHQGQLQKHNGLLISLKVESTCSNFNGQIKKSGKRK